MSDAREPNALRPATVDLLIANPPRAGLREGIAIIEEMSPNRIFMMSCSVKSFVHDVSRLNERGYRVEAVDCYDMFPYTSHIEITAHLRRE